MQATKFLSYILLSLSSSLLLTTATTTSPDLSTITSLTPAESSKIAFDLSTYATAIAADSSLPYYLAAEQSAAGTETGTDFLAAPTNTNTNGSFPDWFTKMPSDAQSFWSSVAGAVETIVTKDVGGNAPRPTGVIAAAGVAAAGVLGVAALL